MEFNQIYKAPLIPKLSKKNISSSVLRGASTIPSISPKLSATKFGFLRPKIKSTGFSFLKPKDVDEDSNNSSVASTLVETNKILIEIQNQLATDFALRIAEEKEEIKKIKSTESKKRFLTKEGAIEKIKDVGSGIKNQVDKILAPAKSIFQKIIDFFKIILTGIVMNAAFKWLENPENQKKLGQFFGFLADHWKWILATLGTVLLIDVIGKLVIAAQGIMAAFALLGTPVGLAILAGLIAAGAASFIRSKEKEIQEKYIAEQSKKSGKKPEEIRKEWIEKVDKPREFMRGLNPSYSLYSTGVEGFSKGGEVFKSLAQKFSTGGSVGGSGSGTKDTVPAMLAPGEYVVRTTATRLFKPFLSDINENAGRLFDQFKQAIIGLTNDVAVQKETSKEFGKILDNFNKFLTSEIKKIKQSKPSASSPSSAAPSVSPGPSVSGESSDAAQPSSQPPGTRVNTPAGFPDLGVAPPGSNQEVRNLDKEREEQERKQRENRARIRRKKQEEEEAKKPWWQKELQKIQKIFDTPESQEIPLKELMRRQGISSLDSDSRIASITPESQSPKFSFVNLPTTTSRAKIPEIPTPTRTATDSPDISPVNNVNPYMQLTPELYGIYV